MVLYLGPGERELYFPTHLLSETEHWRVLNWRVGDGSFGRVMGNLNQRQDCLLGTEREILDDSCSIVNG